MAIFIDSGIVEEIQLAKNMGVLRGVTTNPTILVRDGISGGMEAVKQRTIEIANMIAPYPLSIEVTSNDRQEMIDQAIEFSKWAPNINVKITIHGPNGELENLEVIHLLEKTHNIRVNVTAMMSAQQGFLAALAGATYVSLFGGRVNDMGYNCIDEIKKLRHLLDSFDLKSQIIIGSSRETINVTEWLIAGAHIVTIQPKFLKSMLVHPYTKETVRQFLNDSEKLK